MAALGAQGVRLLVVDGMAELNLFSDTWRIPADADDCECDGESAKRFHLRYFRSLPTAEKIRTIEELERIARVLQRPGQGVQTRRLPPAWCPSR